MASPRLAVGLLVTLASLMLAPAAQARSCLVGDAACPTLTSALASAARNGEADLVRLPPGAVAAAGAAYDSDEPLEVAGAGVAATELTGPVRLDGPRVVLRDVTLVAGSGPALQASGHVRAVRIRGVGVGDAAVAIRALAGAPLVLDDVLVDATGLEAALDAPCANLTARHVTLAGTGRVGARAACGRAPGSALVLDSSIVAAGYPVALEGTGARAAHSSLAGATAGATVSDPVPGEPGFASPADFSLAPGSGLIDRGSPAPLAVDRPAAGEVDRSEPLEDLAGSVRAADGDGDGIARRDVGAYERPAAPLGVPAGNLLVNPGAEAGAASGLPGWAVAGGFEAVAYGTDPFPSASAAAALGTGARFFAGGRAGDSAATQVLDVSGQAAAVDAGAVRAELSGLLGGYRADADLPTVRAAFLAASGLPLGALDLGGAGPDARANATTLLARSAAGALPPLTRRIEVTLRAVKAPGGAYADAYFDNLGLVLSHPADPGAGQRVEGRSLRAFSGLAMLSRRATHSRRRGTTRLLVGCASATVARCTGDLVLEAVLIRRRAREVIGRAKVSLAAGAARAVRVPISPAGRRYLRRHTRLRVRVGTSALDGQGLRRSTTVPIVVRPSGSRAGTR